MKLNKTFYPKKIIEEAVSENKAFSKIVEEDETHIHISFDAGVSDNKKTNENELKELFDENFYDWTINIYYYAVYHSSLALVSLLSYKSKSHMATLCFIIHHYYHNRNKLKEEHIDRKSVV